MNDLNKKIEELIYFAKKHNIDIVIAASNSETIYTAKCGNKLSINGLILTLMQNQINESTETTRN